MSQSVGGGGSLTASSSPSGADPPMPSMTDLLTAHNMRRLLEAYRTLAPLTIGGPASTSLETSPAGLIGSSAAGRTDPLSGRRSGLHHQQQQLLLLQHPPQHYLWPNNSAVCGRIEDGRRRHSSCSSLSPSPHYNRTLSSPHYTKPLSSSSSPSTTTTGDSSPLYPVFSPKDSESSRSGGLQQQQRCCNNGGEGGWLGDRDG